VKKKVKIFLGSLGVLSVAAGIAACKSRKFDSEQKTFSNRADVFNDILPLDYDSWSWDKKINHLWQLNVNAPQYTPYDPSPNSSDPVMGTPEKLPNAKKARKFVSDSIDFRTRPVESIAALTVYSRLRDVYPKTVDFLGMKVKHVRATHPVGSVGWIEFKPKANTPYTGMFKYGAQGLARASGATNSLVTDVLNRSLAIKFPVSGSYSRSLYAMHRVVGQQIGEGQNVKIRSIPPEIIDYRYFKEGKTLTNILQKPEGFENGITDKFMSVVKYILIATGKTVNGKTGSQIDNETLLDITSRLSVDNLAWNKQDGTNEVNPKAPYRVTLLPNPELYKDGPILQKHDFRKDLELIKPGTTLWTVFGTDSKTESRDEIVWGANKQVRTENIIGEIVMVKPFVGSEFANDVIMYKHYVADLQSKAELDAQFEQMGEAPLGGRSSSRIDQFPSNFLEKNTGKKQTCTYVEFLNIAEKKKVFEKQLTDFNFTTSDKAPFCLKTKNISQGFPSELNGVWWVNGNPTAENLITFANANWENNSKILSLKPTSTGNWGFYASATIQDSSNKITEELAGMKHYSNIFEQRLSFKYTPKTSQLEFPAKILLPGIVSALEDASGLKNDNQKGDEELTSITLPEDETLDSNSLNRRANIFNGFLKGDFKLTKIINENGEPLPAYQQYLDTMRRINLTYTAIKN
jgi:hypothetical protein